jgi:hypothetical protein
MGSPHIWNKNDIPRKGWSCIEVYDNDSDYHVCEMCGNTQVRYVHVMRRRDKKTGKLLRLLVGCVCAEHMAKDYVGPKDYETRLSGNAEKRRRLIESPQWCITVKGNYRINRLGVIHVVFFTAGGYKFISDVDGRKYFSERYATYDEAVAALAEYLYPSRLTKEEL